MRMPACSVHMLRARHLQTVSVGIVHEEHGYGYGSCGNKDEDMDPSGRGHGCGYEWLRIWRQISEGPRKLRTQEYLKGPGSMTHHENRLGS